MTRGIPVYILVLLLILSSFFITECTAQNNEPKVLVFSATRGYRHESISAGITALEKLAAKNAFSVYTSEDPEQFNKDNLKKYKAVVFLNTTGSFFNDQQKESFKEFITNGGGFVGIHSATDTFYDWPWYGKLVGAYFLSHPKIQTAALNVTDKKHMSTAKLPAEWKHTDEWYNFKSINPAINVLINLDEESYTGGKNGKNHPVSWYHLFEGGRAFYTALGHTDETYEDEHFLNHLLGGLQWVLQTGEKQQ